MRKDNGKSGEHAFSSTDAQFAKDLAALQAPRAKASDPPRGVRVAGGPLALAADAQRGARACSACTTGATSACRSRRSCSQTTVRALPALGFRGVNVTIPHKEAALALADDATETAARDRRGQHAHVRATAGSTPTTPTPPASSARSTRRPTTAPRSCSARAARPARSCTRSSRRARARCASGTARRTAPQALAAEFGAIVGAEPAEIVVNCTSIGLHDPDETFKALPVQRR